MGCGWQGLFDLETGNQLGALVSQMQERLTKLLPYHNRSMFLASDAQMQRAQERIRWATNAHLISQNWSS